MGAKPKNNRIGCFCPPLHLRKQAKTPLFSRFFAILKTFGVSRETRVSKKLFHVKLINYRYFNCLIFCHSSDNRTAVAFVSPFRPFDIRGRLPRGAFAFALSCFCASPTATRLADSRTEPQPALYRRLNPLCAHCRGNRLLRGFSVCFT